MDNVLRAAVDAGVNYVDLVYTELDYWNDFGPVFRTYRDKLVMAAHWGSGPRYDLDYCQRTFANILSCVGNDYAEVAIMTMVDEEKKWDEWVQESAEYLNRYKEQGRIGYIGGSGHDPSMVIKAINSGLFDVFMFPVNIVGHNSEKIRALCQACVDRNVGLVAMKPYFGGTLLYVDGKVTSITPAQCLAYVLSLPVSTTVPGPKNAQELRATLHYLEATDEEKNYRPAIASMYRDLAGHCVYCNHCLPCPQNIEIGMTILLTDWAHGGVSDELIGYYSSLPVKASECTECGVCMERCPFEVDVITKMREAVEIFEAKTG
jgi:predicted aldo/keto reductase-like oxidoreductase